MFTSVAAFDIRVYSPDSALQVILGVGSIADVGDHSDACSSRPGGIIGMSVPDFGGYVDLGKASGILGSPASLVGVPYTEQVYDTGTSQYNRNQPDDGGANGVDDNANGIVDEPAEGDVIAPYNTPVRGIEFTMRVIEPNTKQVRQLTVRKSFVGE